MCEEREVLRFKVPLFCPSTAGVPAHREGLYGSGKENMFPSHPRSQSFSGMGGRRELKVLDDPGAMSASKDENRAGRSENHAF